MNAIAELTDAEVSLQGLDQSITKKKIKFQLATVLSVKANSEEMRGFYKHRADLFEGELKIMNEGHARLTKKYLKQLN